MEFTRTSAVEGGPKIPPPPAEVGIRTMASDLEAIRESGGQPQFVNTKMAVHVQRKINWGPILWIGGAMIGVIAFFLIGYYVIFPLLG